MKKNFFIALLFFLISPNLFADGIPTWYTEDINVSEQEISRKNSEGVYADFIDRTFSACSYVKVDDEIQSLEEARTAAEKVASEKLDSYLKAHKENEALKNEHILQRWSYDYSLANGGAYVQVQVVVKKEKPKAPEYPSVVADTKKELSENPNPGRVIMYGSDRLTLVDTIKFSSEESIEAHRVAVTTKEDGGGKLSKYSTSKSVFYYPDGTLISDTVYNLTNTVLEFTPKNIVKGRKTLIIIRTDVSDVFSDSDEIRLSYRGHNYKSKFEKDRKNSWRNVIFELEEGTITEYSPQILIEDSEKKVSIGTIFVYQKL